MALAVVACGISPPSSSCAGCAAWERWAKGWAANLPSCQQLPSSQPLAPPLATGEKRGHTWQQQQPAVPSPTASADCVAFVSIAQPSVRPPMTAAAAVKVPPSQAAASSAPSAAVSTADTLPRRQGSAVVAAAATGAAFPLVSHPPPVHDPRFVLRPQYFTFPTVTLAGIPSAQLPPLSQGFVYTAAAAAVNSPLPLDHASADTGPVMLLPLSHAAPQQQQQPLTAAMPIPQHTLESAIVAPDPEEWQEDDECDDYKGGHEELIQPRPCKRKVGAEDQCQDDRKDNPCTVVHC